MNQFLRLCPGLCFETMDADVYESTLDALQDAVDGPIEIVTHLFNLPEGITAYANEEGLFRDLQLTLCYSRLSEGGIDYLPLLGNIVFCRTDEEGNDVALSTDDMISILNSIAFMSKTNQLAPYPVLFKDFTGLFA